MKLFQIVAGQCITIITVQLLSCMHKQKLGKAVGPDDISMEAIVSSGPKLAVHLCILFNLFLQYIYLPAGFMHSVIIYLVKNKCGDPSDVNNYLAIAIPTSISKLFESTTASEIFLQADDDKYQSQVYAH